MEHNILEGELKFESEIYYEDNSNSKIVTVSENAKSLLKVNIFYYIYTIKLINLIL